MQRKKKRRRKKVRYYCIFAIFLFFMMKVIMEPLLFQKLTTYTHKIMGKQSINVITNGNNNYDNAINSSIHSSNIYLVNRETREVLLDKNSNEKIYPASMTKIMSVLIGIEHLTDLDKRVTVPEEIRDLQFIHASVAGFSLGERVTVRDLFYAALIPSGADACLGIVYNVSETEEDFVRLMNGKAREIGMKNTHFTGPIGFHESNHYTTAQDMALLFDYALDNPTFYELITTKNYTTTPTDNHPSGIPLESTLFDADVSTQLKEGEILGGKTGTTAEAGRCLTSFAKINGETYILVTAGAHGPNEMETDYHIMDAVNIYNSI